MRKVESTEISKNDIKLVVYFLSDFYQQVSLKYCYTRFFL